MVKGADKQKVGQFAAEVRRVAQAGTVQGQGHSLRKRSRSAARKASPSPAAADPRGSRHELSTKGIRVMDHKSQTSCSCGGNHVRRKIVGTAERPRLTRLSQLQAHLRPADRRPDGRDAGRRQQPRQGRRAGRPTAATSRRPRSVGKKLAEVGQGKGHRQGGLRSRPLSLSWPRQGAGRRRPRRRVAVLEQLGHRQRLTYRLGPRESVITHGRRATTWLRRDGRYDRARRRIMAEIAITSAGRTGRSRREDPPLRRRGQGRPALQLQRPGRRRRQRAGSPGATARPTKCRPPSKRRPRTPRKP